MSSRASWVVVIVISYRSRRRTGNSSAVTWFQQAGPAHDQRDFGCAASQSASEAYTSVMSACDARRNRRFSVIDAVSCRPSAHTVAMPATRRPSCRSWILLPLDLPGRTIDPLGGPLFPAALPVRQHRRDLPSALDLVDGREPIHEPVALAESKAISDTRLRSCTQPTSCVAQNAHPY